MSRYLDPLALGFVVYGLVHGAVAVGVGLLFGLFGGFASMAGLAEGDGELVFIGAAYGTIGVVVAVLASLMALPAIIAGVGLWRRAGWARWLGLGIACLSLTNMPLGTLLGALALFVLLDKDVEAELA
ncbi:MAG: hypothetical protein ACI9K2_004502 [Myxococcota bacterium]